jgi:hypothetical protein
MIGNVREWVEDRWHANYQGAPDDGRPWTEAGGKDSAGRLLEQPVLLLPRRLPQTGCPEHPPGRSAFGCCAPLPAPVLA